ncbi:MAG: hypothetical protein CML05_11830 [Pseudozobellia sp.]|nr:hypothetical protein [Pseudozobellia sp.]
MHKNSVNDTPYVTQNVTQKAKSEISWTDKSIRYLKPKSKRKTYWFKGLEGFGIRVSPKGSKTWIYTFRIDGQLRKMTLGRYPRLSVSEAIEAYSQALEKKQKGIDPATEKVERNQYERQAETVQELLDQYITYQKAMGKKSWKSEYNELNRNIIPAIGRMKVHQVKKKHLVPIFSEMIMVRNAPQGARHLFAYVRRMFNMAIMWALIEVNPCRAIKLNISPNRRERHLSPKEVYLFWHRLEEVNTVPVVRLALKFMLCTASRGIEVREMRWADLDERDKLWTIPKTKNFRMHRVHLGETAMNIIREVKKYTGSCPYVFGASKSPWPPKILSSDLTPLFRTSICKTVRKVRTFKGFKEPFVPHDLRRTAATMITAMGCPRYWAKLLLNHTDHDVTGIYDQYAYDWEKKKGLEVLDFAIQRIIQSKSLEEVPSLLNLREETINPRFQPAVLSPLANTQVGLTTNFANPVTYRLSYDHDGLKKQD